MCFKGYLSKEARLLFFLSRVNPEVAALEQAQSLINSSINWDLFTSLCNKHGTTALVYKNLLKLGGVPQHIIDKFQKTYHNQLRQNILKVSELDRITDGLNKRGIEVISLKGATASEKIFGDIGVYPSGDIDILVRIEDLDRVREFLERDGYTLNDKGFDEYREFFIKEQYHISLSNERFTIEPHWNLFVRYFTTPPDFWWAESRMVTSGGKKYRFLSPEKNILYSSFRLFSKGFVPLQFLVLLAEIIRYYKDEIDWVKMFEYAKRYRFESTLRVTLKLSSDLLGAPVKDGYNKLDPLRAKVLYKGASRNVLKTDVVHPLEKLLFAFLRDDISGVFKILLRRLFPSMGEIVARYRLKAGSAKAVVYYIFNPLFLMMRKHQ